jgi:hypothetical protein
MVLKFLSDPTRYFQLRQFLTFITEPEIVKGD